MLNRILPLFEGETSAPTGGSGFVSIIMIVLIVVVFYFMYRSQKKQERESAKMRDGLEVGDEITTIGGICGKVVSVKENNLVIETGTDRTRMLITRWSVQQNNSAMERVAAEREAAKAAQQKEKEARLEAKGKSRKKKEDLEDKY